MLFPKTCPLLKASYSKYEISLGFLICYVERDLHYCLNVSPPDEILVDADGSSMEIYAQIYMGIAAILTITISLITSVPASSKSLQSVCCLEIIYYIFCINDLQAKIIKGPLVFLCLT